ncbi:NETI motif-containing protein [Halobacillus salinus]|uniref:NETI motif-containing protein n=1 Tax=Halobacillus salinus TaxID=192814 RepID=A0A4Z0GUZ8_9BACI|nr:NETI motif-containing protein [Halobacillus salinus]TGB01038.1 NETI motif-containing protein [Halobacillus salinus]
MPKKNSNKKRFEVLENETIGDCLDRMKKEGYTPVRRAEEPIFKEEVRDGEKVMEPIGSKIVFQGVKQ